MQEICLKMNAEILSEKCRRDHLRSLWRSVVPVTVHRWQHREPAEGRWGSLTKCGITKLVTVRHGYDGPSCRFVVKIREVIPVTRFQELKYFETKTLDGPLCLWRFVTLAVEGNEESSRRNSTKYGTTESTMVRSDHDGPSRGPSAQPHFGRFPVIRILVKLGFYFL